jgi:hypothetical protein
MRQLVREITQGAKIMLGHRAIVGDIDNGKAVRACGSVFVANIDADIVTCRNVPDKPVAGFLYGRTLLQHRAKMNVCSIPVNKRIDECNFGNKLSF